MPTRIAAFPMNPLTPELTYLTWSAALTGLIWVPIILNRLREMGLWKALRNPEPDVRPHAQWAYRMANAHRNAIENLVVFAPLVLAAHVLGVGNGLTATAAAVFFFSRLAHLLIYTCGVPLLRTVAFVAGVWAQAVFAIRILAA